MKPALIYYKENVFSQLDYFQNIRLATSGHTVDERFYLTFNDLSESYNKEGITAIFIMNTLSDNAIELQGLQMAHYIRIITRGEAAHFLNWFRKYHRIITSFRLFLHSTDSGGGTFTLF